MYILLAYIDILNGLAGIGTHLRVSAVYVYLLFVCHIGFRVDLVFRKSIIALLGKVICIKRSSNTYEMAK